MSDVIERESDTLTYLRGSDGRIVTARELQIVLPSGARGHGYRYEPPLAIGEGVCIRLDKIA